MIDDHAETLPAPPLQVYGAEAYLHGEDQERSFLASWKRGRVHHAWMLCGPQGIGKATFAQRIARFVLAEQRDQTQGLLGISKTDPAAQLISAAAHPDFTAVTREPGKKFISVDQIRHATSLFMKSPSRAAHRVIIIDAIDDLNINSANALLKSLEEPPEKSLWLLICHNPGTILATIRSRCRVLNFRPWADLQVKAFLSTRIEADEEDIVKLTRLADGVPGRGLSLWSAGGTAMDALSEMLLGDSPPDPVQLIRAAEPFRQAGARGDGPRRFALFKACLQGQIRVSALNSVNSHEASQWAGLWSAIDRADTEAEALNMDRFDYFFHIYEMIKRYSQFTS